MEIIVPGVKKNEYRGLILPGAPEYSRKVDGTILMDGSPDTATTRQCCHCGTHFVMIKGSGKHRGWCLECGDITCGGPNCNECFPFEKRVSFYEKGQIRDWQEYAR